MTAISGKTDFYQGFRIKSQEIRSRVKSHESRVKKQDNGVRLYEGRCHVLISRFNVLRLSLLISAGLRRLCCLRKGLNPTQKAAFPVITHLMQDLILEDHLEEIDPDLRRTTLATLRQELRRVAAIFP